VKLGQILVKLNCTDSTHLLYK